MYCTSPANEVEDTCTMIMRLRGVVEHEVSDWELNSRLLKWTGDPSVETHFEVIERLAIYIGPV